MRITFEQANELLRYDPETGDLFWLKDRGGSVRAGDKAGSLNNAGYMRASILGRTYTLHRVAWLLHFGDWPHPDFQLDHINRNRSDNRLANLRIVTPQGNRLNSNPHPRYRNGGTRGVYFNRALRKWQVHAKIDGRLRYAGVFSDRTSAIQHRDQIEIGAF